MLQETLTLGARASGVSVIARWWIVVKIHNRWKVESGKHKHVACDDFPPFDLEY